MPPKVNEPRSSIEVQSPPRETCLSSQLPLSTSTCPAESVDFPLSTQQLLLSYTPPAAIYFTLQEIQEKKSRLTRQAYVHAVVEHPLGAIVEYPETGLTSGIGVAHIFPVDLDATEFFNPRRNIQYSLGEPQGYHHNVKCHQLRNIETGEPVVCLQEKAGCEYFIYFRLLFVFIS